MTGKIINLILRDHIAVWNGKTIGATIPVFIIVGALGAPFMKFFNLIYIWALVYFALEPFSLEELYRTGRFFASLPVRRRDIVLSRYLGLIIIIVLYLILAYAFNLIIILAIRPDFMIPPGYYAVALVTASLLSFSFPLFFKFGIIKARPITGIIYFGGFVGFITAFSNNPERMTNILNILFPDSFLTALLFTGISILLFLMSITLSTAVYSKKDL